MFQIDVETKQRMSGSQSGKADRICRQPPAGSGWTLLCALFLLLPVLGCKETDLDEEKAIHLFEKLHRRIYEVYRLENPVAIFQLLSKSLEGKELEQQVFEYLKCLRVQAEFSTKITILDVIYTDIRVLGTEKEQVSIYCKWVVIGKIRHPTHIHRKNNLNEAIYWMRLGPEGPRITGYDQITNQALEISTR